MGQSLAAVCRYGLPIGAGSVQARTQNAFSSSAIRGPACTATVLRNWERRVTVSVNLRITTAQNPAEASTVQLDEVWLPTGGGSVGMCKLRLVRAGTAVNVQFDRAESLLVPLNGHADSC